MKCPKCHRDTYSAKWGTCTSCGAINTKPAINEERLTDAINVVHSSVPTRDSIPEALPAGNSDSRVNSGRDAGSAGKHVVRTPNRRSREAYNAYMRDYMARRRAT